jgi:hypothetical protein
MVTGVSLGYRQQGWGPEGVTAQIKGQPEYKEGGRGNTHIFKKQIQDRKGGGGSHLQCPWHQIFVPKPACQGDPHHYPPLRKIHKVPTPQALQK